MKIAVISDLHLGPADNTDLFGHDDAEFLRFLQFLESNFERIVLLGDIWETLSSKVPWTPEQALRACRRAHPEIARRFAAPQYHYVHGNHDYVTRWLGTPDHLDLKSDGIRLHFTHGHGHDLIIRRARWLTELGVCFGAWLRRMGAVAFYRALENAERWTSAARIDPARCKFQQWALQMGRQRQADIIVTGHTHLAVRAEHPNQLFMNSGTCSYGKTTFLALDTKRADYRVCNSW